MTSLERSLQGIEKELHQTNLLLLEIGKVLKEREDRFANRGKKNAEERRDAAPSEV